MQKKSWVSIVLYVLGAVMVIYALYSLIGAVQYVSSYVEQGYISYADSFGEILAYYVSTVGPNLFYAVVLLVLGYVVSLLKNGAAPKKAAEAEVQAETATASVCGAEAPSTPGPRYCKNCYKVFAGGEVPEVCPDCGAEL